MKTAMQELIEWIDENSPHCKIDSLVREVAEKLLKKEREQILSSYDAGKEQPSNSQLCPIDYYDQNFK